MLQCLFDGTVSRERITRRDFERYIHDCWGKGQQIPCGVQFFVFYVVRYLESHFITNSAGLPSISGERWRASLK
jgi:hypothetical protein